MNTSSIMGLMDVMILLCGVYILYLSFVMIKTGKLKENALMPKDLEMKKCKDVAGFIRYMRAKQIILGGLAVISGAVGLAQDYGKLNSPVLYLGTIVVFIACVVWYCVAVKKASRVFW
ncbi:hypothetical protein [Parablautia sp. Marseille-Q6255]|uniref:hypothetical protein n=1 Tax=Parablautia sp. Marseille-Q6255 TaxID=3039593 RepID=UPI0024BC15B3|nr:hypothetical protein [Parablautia sp. Marseille-Q6255]